MRASRIGYGLLLLAALCVPFTGIYPVFAMKLLCYGLFACAFNLLLGFTRMLSFGHTAYFGAAAYCTGWLATVQGWGTVESILGGVVAATLLGAVIGAIAIRRQGIYFAMITLALAQLVYFVFLQAPFSGGENGLQSIPRGSLLGIVPLQSDTSLYFVVLAIFVASFLFIRRIVHSPFGQVLKAIRENEPRAVSLGYNVERYKLVAFVLSAALAGLAGSTKAIVLGFVTLTDVSQGSSGEVILMTLVGGTGTFFGPLVGAGIIVALQDYLSDRVGSWVTVIMGAIFVACVMAFRRGIVGEWQHYFALRRSASRRPAAAT
jgi:branched-chain amino acid transport system permease protein